MKQESTEQIEGLTDAEKLTAKGYAILNDGTILGIGGKPLKLHKGTGGYYQLNTGRAKSQRTYLLHRLVAQLYIPNPDNLPEVNHIDGDKSNNKVANLQWCTRPQNIQHGFDTGLIPKGKPHLMGSKNKRSKTVIQMSSNGDIVATYGSTGEAANATGFDRNSIQDACRGVLKTYKTFLWKYKQ